MKRRHDARFTSVACLSALLGAGCVGTVGGDAAGTPDNGNTSGGNTGGGNGPGNGNTGQGNGNTGNGNGQGNGNGNGQGGPASADTAGRTPMRRLTHAQFNNTVHDLLGVDGDFTNGFSLDEDTSGFRANVTSPVSDSQVDKYDQTADQLASKAVAAGLDKLAPCLPPKAEADCAADFVKSFGKRAFRRPLTDEQVTRYRAVWDAGKKADGTFAGGVGLVISAMLQSPNFLYLPEIGVGGNGNAPVALDSYEIASRLSYFLQDSMPDADLFAAADADKLKGADEVANQTRRLLGSPRAKTVLAGFFRQWLESESVPSLDKDPAAFPMFTPELRAAMGAELDAFTTHVMSGTGAGADGKLATLLTGNFVFPQGPLAGLYGVQTGTGRVDAPAGQRSGLLTLAGIMALYAHPDQSAPVSRGYLVSEKLLCVVPPPAPDNVVINLPKPDPSKTTRERFAAHREAPQCASCHALMDPYGLTFENYDAIGRFRDRDGNNAVDATSELPAYGKVKNASELLAKMTAPATSKEVAACMTRQWYRFALGRVESDVDMGSLATAEDAFKRADLRIPDLIVALTGTPAFRQRPPVR
jgi:hypothetical protein